MPERTGAGTGAWRAVLESQQFEPRRCCRSDRLGVRRARAWRTEAKGMKTQPLLTGPASRDASARRMEALHLCWRASLTFELTPRAEAGGVSPVRDDATPAADWAYDACRSESRVERVVRRHPYTATLWDRRLCPALARRSCGSRSPARLCGRRAGALCSGILGRWLNVD